jgi:hypothetical protein
MVLRSMSLPQCNRRMRIRPPRFCTNACAHFIECNGRSPVLGSESPKTELASNMSSTQRPEEIEFQARERSVNVSHSWRGVRSDRAGILMEDFTFKVNLVAVVRVRAGDESVARKTVPTVLGAPGIAEIRLANENNAATGRHATVTDVDFSIGSVVPARNRRPRTTR